MMKNCRPHSLWALAMLACVVLSLPANADESTTPLPDPDGKPANMSMPVQVYILLGQSNMLGAGKINGGNGSLTHAVKEKNKYPYLVDNAGGWTERKDVRNVRVMGSGTGAMKVYNNEWMAIKGGNIGPEIGIGHHVGHVTDAPVLILKSCIGNRSLGYDLLPPGAEGREEPKPGGKWYAGIQYDGDIANAKTVLSELDKYYPGAKRYVIAGFFFWQGDKDRYDANNASRYEQNLVLLIKALRKDFDAPNAKFVCATLGQTAKGAGGNEGKILEAQLAVDGKSGKYPQYRGNVATVYSKPHCHGGASNGHYGGNAETYMDVGEAMGRAMVELLGSQSSLDELTEHLDADSRPVYKALKAKKYSAAYKAFKKFAAAHKANVKAKKLDKDALVAQAELLKAFKQGIRWPLDQAVAEIEGLKKSGDVYRLSLVFREHDKAFKGIYRFDDAVGELGKELKSSKMRSAISAGKKFYSLIDQIKRSEAKRKGPRSAASIKSFTAYLNRFASREDDNIYGKAASAAAEKIADPNHAVGSASSYIQMAQ